MTNKYTSSKSEERKPQIIDDSSNNDRTGTQQNTNSKLF